MRYTRCVTVECEADCGRTFAIPDGSEFIGPSGAQIAGKYGVVPVNALAHTALVREGWVAFSSRGADDAFDEITGQGPVHVGRLNRMLLVCPVCAPEFVPPLSETAKHELAQQTEKDRAVLEAIGKLEAELAALKAQVAS